MLATEQRHLIHSHRRESAGLVHRLQAGIERKGRSGSSRLPPLHPCSYFSNRWLLSFPLLLPPKHLPQWRLSFLPTAHWLFRIYGRRPPRSVSEDAEGSFVVVLCLPCSQYRRASTFWDFKNYYDQCVACPWHEIIRKWRQEVWTSRSSWATTVILKSTWVTWDPRLKKKTKRRKVCSGSLLCDWEGTMAKKCLVFGGGRLKHDWFQSQLTLLKFYLHGKSTHVTNTKFCCQLKI